MTTPTKEQIEKDLRELRITANIADTFHGRDCCASLDRIEAVLQYALDAWGDNHKFKIGDRVTKIKGSQWTGRVVGFYSTELTLMGYAVESETEKGSVQIYPEAALTAAPKYEGEK